MTRRVHPVPDGFHTVTPYLLSPDPEALVAFLARAFGAAERFRARGAQGGLHIEVQIGDSMVMVGGGPGGPARPATLFLYLGGVDEAYRRAVAAGATTIAEPADRPDQGDRRATVADPFGNAWYLATRIDDVPRADLQARREGAPGRG